MPRVNAAASAQNCRPFVSGPVGAWIVVVGIAVIYGLLTFMVVGAIKDWFRDR